MGEAAHSLHLVDGLRRRAALREIDQLAEVLGAVGAPLLEVPDARISSNAGGEDALPIGLLDRNDAIRGHQDRPTERLEFHVLAPPRAAVVPGQVPVRLEFGVVVRGDHLAVGVDVDAGPLGLLEQLQRVLEVVPGDEDAWPIAHAKGELRRARLAEGCGVGAVEKRHGLRNDATGLERECEQFVERGLLGDGRQRLERKRADGEILLAEDARVRCPGADALERVGGELPQRADVLVLGLQHADAIGHRVHPLGRRIVPARLFGKLRALAGGDVLEQSALESHSALDARDDPLAVEVGVGDGRVERLEDEAGELAVYPLGRARCLAQPLEHVDQQVLIIGGLLGLAAGATRGAAGTVAGLLALEAEHVHRAGPRVSRDSFRERQNSRGGARRTGLIP